MCHRTTQVIVKRRFCFSNFFSSYFGQLFIIAWKIIRAPVEHTVKFFECRSGNCVNYFLYRFLHLYYLVNVLIHCDEEINCFGFVVSLFSLSALFVWCEPVNSGIEVWSMHSLLIKVIIAVFVRSRCLQFRKRAFILTQDIGFKEPHFRIALSFCFQTCSGWCPEHDIVTFGVITPVIIVEFCSKCSDYPLIFKLTLSHYDEERAIWDLAAGDDTWFSSTYLPSPGAPTNHEPLPSVWCTEGCVLLYGSCHEARISKNMVSTTSIQLLTGHFSTGALGGLVCENTKSIHLKFKYGLLKWHFTLTCITALGRNLDISKPSTVMGLLGVFDSAEVSRCDVLPTRTILWRPCIWY